MINIAEPTSGVHFLGDRVKWPEILRGRLPDGGLRVPVARVFHPLERPGPKYKGAKGGRGSGKSHYFAEKLVKACVSNPNSRIMCVREVQQSLKDSVKKLIEDKIDDLGVGRHFEVLETIIYVLDPKTGARAGLIIFLGMQNHTARSIKSLEGFTIAWVEEAQSLTQRSLDLLYPTIRDAEGEIWFSWNPEKATDPVEKFMCGEGWDPKTKTHTDPDIVVVIVNYHDNPYFKDTSLVGDMERDKRRDPEKYAHIWLGAYLKRSNASVFTNWCIEDFQTPARMERFYFGADWGFSVDPSVLVRCFVGRWGLNAGEVIPDPNGKHLFIDREVYKVGCEIDETPALFAGDDPLLKKDTSRTPRWTNHLMHQGIEGATQWPIVADSSRPETISYMQKRGFNIKPAVKGPGSVEEGIEFLRDYDIVVHPSCVHTADELSLYSYKVDPKTDDVLPVLEDKDNHVIDSLRYAVEGIRRRTSMKVSKSLLEASRLPARVR